MLTLNPDAAVEKGTTKEFILEERGLQQFPSTAQTYNGKMPPYESQAVLNSRRNPYAFLSTGITGSKHAVF